MRDNRIFITNYIIDYLETIGCIEKEDYDPRRKMSNERKDLIFDLILHNQSITTHPDITEVNKENIVLIKNFIIKQMLHKMQLSTFKLERFNKLFNYTNDIDLLIPKLILLKNRFMNINWQLTVKLSHFRGEEYKFCFFKLDQADKVLSEIGTVLHLIKEKKYDDVIDDDLHLSILYLLCVN